MSFAYYLNERIQSNLTKMQKDSLSFYENKIEESFCDVENCKKPVLIMSFLLISFK